MMEGLGFVHTCLKKGKCFFQCLAVVEVLAQFLKCIRFSVQYNIKVNLVITVNFIEKECSSERGECELLTS